MYVVARLNTTSVVRQSDATVDVHNSRRHNSVKQSPEQHQWVPMFPLDLDICISCRSLSSVQRAYKDVLYSLVLCKKETNTHLFFKNCMVDKAVHNILCYYCVQICLDCLYKG